MGCGESPLSFSTVESNSGRSPLFFLTVENDSGGSPLFFLTVENGLGQDTLTGTKSRAVMLCVCEALESGPRERLLRRQRRLAGGLAA